MVNALTWEAGFGWGTVVGVVAGDVGLGFGAGGEVGVGAGALETDAGGVTPPEPEDGLWALGALPAVPSLPAGGTTDVVVGSDGANMVVTD